jgi:hypothetical protein
MAIKQFNFFHGSTSQTRWVSVYFYPHTFIVETDIDEERINYYCSWLSLQYPGTTFENFRDLVLRDLRSIFDNAQYYSTEHTRQRC